MNSIDIYCERVGVGLTAEPINALTNGAFLVAALLLSQRMKDPTIEVRLLIRLLFLIGLGSFLFHTFATGWARYLDVAPILLFQMLFVWSYTTKFFGWSTRVACIGVSIFLGVVLFARSFPMILNGSLPYVPSWLVLICFSFYHFLNKLPKRFFLIIASVMFTFSLLLRTLDASLCDQFPFGTHFIWHLANALVLYLSVSVLNPIRR
ncbi:ceramidase domain-containing protein [Vibrio ouci]|uniref:Ceramidase n=1 Tax=Vibrio ouci TaxID=2499078 RepID=A0A4Y8W9N7_9VIBR|nr:hypothetical protein ELS82_22830 [Vibrio ouci]